MENKEDLFFDKIAQIIPTFSDVVISKERAKTLHVFIDYLQSKVDQHQPILLNFICTHNSRRSHLAQVWAQTMARYFDVSNVECYSGGTEATALFPVVAQTLERTGFEVKKLQEQENPQYSLKFGEKEAPILGFSKVYDDPFNPQTNFAAIMTCSQADNDCPMISGAEKRIALSYDDPKLFDGTEVQLEKYQERSVEIATEMYYVFSQVQR